MLDFRVNSWEAIEHLWRSTDWFERGDVALLAVMLVNMIVIICPRFYRHIIARRQSRAFIRDASDAFRDGRFDEVVVIAVRNSRSHVAAVFAAGLTTFASAPLEFTHTEAIEAAERAVQRSCKMQAAELKLGLGTLSLLSVIRR